MSIKFFGLVVLLVATIYCANEHSSGPDGGAGWLETQILDCTIDGIALSRWDIGAELWDRYCKKTPKRTHKVSRARRVVQKS
jgi:hypothetical protein